MIPINTIDFISIEEVKSNPDKYKKIYLEDKIIVFRNANLNKEEQSELMIFFGDLLGWYPNSINSNKSEYTETHHKHMNEGVNVSKDELMLSWHIEHVQNEEDSHHGATWRMEKFECPDDSGHTYFVDMAKMFKDLNLEDQEFLSKCTNILETTEFRYKTDLNDLEKEKEEFIVSKEFACVNTHPITKEKTVRVSLFASNGTLNSLSKFDCREPSEEEKDRFLRLTKWICNEVWTNENIRMVLKWKQGDLAVPDLYKLAHSVSGGFTKNQRVLSGQFGKALPWGT
jgi:alpha-ketoglutarate-dependent taurine dioxygenase